MSQAECLAKFKPKTGGLQHVRTLGSRIEVKAS
jgi:hypothetical protein